MIEQHELCEFNREMHFGLHVYKICSPGVHIDFIRQNLRDPQNMGQFQAYLPGSGGPGGLGAIMRHRQA